MRPWNQRCCWQACCSGRTSSPSGDTCDTIGCDSFKIYFSITQSLLATSQGGVRVTATHPARSAQGRWAHGAPQGPTTALQPCSTPQQVRMTHLLQHLRLGSPLLGECTMQQHQHHCTSLSNSSSSRQAMAQALRAQQAQEVQAAAPAISAGRLQGVCASQCLVSRVPTAAWQPGAMQQPLLLQATQTQTCWLRRSEPQQQRQKATEPASWQQQNRQQLCQLLLAAAAAPAQPGPCTALAAPQHLPAKAKLAAAAEPHSHLHMQAA